MQQIKHPELTEKIIGVFFNVYHELGWGFVESVYDEAFSVSLTEAGLVVRRQVPLAVWYHGQQIGEFKPDMIVNELVLLELKAVDRLEASHDAQLLNYLKATDFEVGLLLNFGPQPQIHRRVFDNARKAARAFKKTVSG